MFFVRRAQPRTLTFFLAFIVLPRTVLFGTLAGALLLGQAMAVDPLAAEVDGSPMRIPVWTAADAAAQPGCVSSADWPEGRLADSVVVHSFRDGLNERMAFDAAWRVNHNATETDDVWVVGICP